MSHRRIIAAVGLTAAAAFAAPPAHSETCASVAVEARGEPASFMWLAKTKARANWRHKVREMTGLGADFSNWSRASNAQERCLSGPSGTLCIFTGYPCKASP
jgi:hypothetical protein